MPYGRRTKWREGQEAQAREEVRLVQGTAKEAAATPRLELCARRSAPPKLLAASTYHNTSGSACSGWQALHSRAGRTTRPAKAARAEVVEALAPARRAERPRGSPIEAKRDWIEGRPSIMPSMRDLAALRESDGSARLVAVTLDITVRYVRAMPGMPSDLSCVYLYLRP